MAAPGDPTINVWYGSQQVFGDPGIAQRWVNILGNASDPDGLSWVRYSLNGAPLQSLGIGPDTRRLLEPGDFNVEIAVTDLVEGMNSIEIVARDTNFATTTGLVTLEYVANTVWPLPYSVDWNTVTNLQDVSQIVDGKWTVTSNGLRPTVLGYDRTIAFGDRSWTDYEVTVPITLHGIQSSVCDLLTGPCNTNGCPWPSVGPAMAVLARWPGHTAVDGKQPTWGYEPAGAGVWYDMSCDGPLRLSGDDGLSVEDDQRVLSLETPYIFKLRVESAPGIGTYYATKVWEQGQPEPQNWDLDGYEGLTDVPSGSCLIVAHHVDLTVGNLTITSLGDTDPPVISNVQVVAGTDSATVTWTTDEPATSIIDYGLSETYSDSFVDPTLETSHTAVLQDLATNSLHHYRIGGEDAAQNLGQTGDLTFTTTACASPLDMDFETVLCGDNPAGWLDTDTNNSLAENDTLFAVACLSGNEAFSTTSGLADIHSHYVDACSPNWADYTYTGRLMFEPSSGGMGVTFLSDYPASDAYYRLSFVGTAGFQVMSHGTTVTGGVTDSGVVPVADSWYRFRIEVLDTGSQTEIRARVWADGDNEPTSWPIDCYDDGANRLLSGGVGVWATGPGAKYWDDLKICAPDCDMNDVPDQCDTDCNSNGTPDACEVFSDCNSNAVPDECELAGNDCNTNAVPDECELTGNDCNSNGAPDECDADCNTNGTPDDCEAFTDCNTNGVPDECELAGNDCNANGVPDGCDLDCNTNGTPDACESFSDCNSNAIPDECELAANDCNTNGVPDECDLDCNTNGTPDACEVFADCNTNAVPDECELTGNDCNTNGVPDQCDPDCNTNGTPDDCEAFTDCNTNGVPDECDADCDKNGTPDDCESHSDCNTNGWPDTCDVLAGTSMDANGDVVPDECQVRNLTQQTAYTTIADAMAAAANGDDIRAPADRFVAEPTIDYLNRSVHLFSDGAIVQPAGGVITLADDSSLVSAPGRPMSIVGELLVGVLDRADASAGAFSLDSNGLLTVQSSSGLDVTSASAWLGGVTQVDPQATLAFSSPVQVPGTVTVYGGVLVTNLLTISADSGLLQGYGQVAGSIQNDHNAVFIADTQILGDLTNNGVTTVQNGILTVNGSITDNGQIIGDVAALRDESLRSPTGLTVLGNYLAGAGATLRLPGSELTMKIGGDFDCAIDAESRFDFSMAVLQAVGLTGTTQNLEAMSYDVGPYLFGLAPGRPGGYPIGTLRIGPTPATVYVVDQRDNDQTGQATAEAVYVDYLQIDAGAMLVTGPYTVYYRTLSNLGMVDDPNHLVQLVNLPGDCDGDGSVNDRDMPGLVACLAGPAADPPGYGGCDCEAIFDLDGDGDIDLADFATFQALHAD